MSLDSVITKGMQGLNVDQKMISIAMQNVSRANEKGYNRIDANVSNASNGGVEIRKIGMVVDELLVSERDRQMTKLSYANNFREYYDTLSSYLGSMDINNNYIMDNFSEKISEFIISIEHLANTNNYASKQNVMSKTKRLVNSLKEFINNIYNLQHEIDKKIKVVIADINSTLRNLAENNAMRTQQINGESTLIDIDKDDMNNINKLSKYIDVNTVRESVSNVLRITTTSGISLLDFVNRNLSYVPSENANNLREYSFKPIYTSGQKSNTHSVLVTGGKSKDVTTKLQSGALKALVDFRDKVIPSLLDKMDNFVHTFVQEFNHMYSQAAACLNNIVSDVEINKEDKINFSGDIRFALLDKNGNAILDDDGSNIRPFKYIFDTNVNSRFGMNDIIDAINGHFFIGGNKVSKGDIDNIKLVVQRYENNGVHFNMAIDKMLCTSTDVKLRSVSTMQLDPFNNVIPLNGVFVSGVNSSQLYKLEKSGMHNIANDLSLFASGNIPSNVIIRTEFEIDGEVIVIDYDIETTQSEINKYYKPQSLVSGGNAEFTGSTNEMQYIEADIVDKLGNIISDGQNGYLSVHALDSENVVAIDSGNAKDLDLDYDGRHKNFACKFGLNNFFNVPQEVNGAAENIVISEFLSDNIENIIIGQVPQSMACADNETYSIGKSNNVIGLKLIELFDNTVNFGKYNDTIIGASRKIVFDIVNDTTDAYETEEREGRFYGIINLRHDAVSGVNIDEEVAKVSMLERHYATTAKIISIAQDLHKLTLDMFGR